MDDVKIHCTCSRLSACALGCAFGLLSALVVLIIGSLAYFYEYGTAWVTMASSVYVGYAPTPLGILIGVVWGFVEGFVLGALLAGIYNVIVKKCPCKSCKEIAEGPSSRRENL